MAYCALRRGLTAASKPKQTFLACCDGSAGLWRARGEPASAPLGTSVSSAPSAALSWTGASSSADPHIEKPKYLYGNEVIQYMTDGDPGELWHEKIWNEPLYTEEEEMFEVVSEELHQASLKRRDDKELVATPPDSAAEMKPDCPEAKLCAALEMTVKYKHDIEDKWQRITQHWGIRLYIAGGPPEFRVILDGGGNEVLFQYRNSCTMRWEKEFYLRAKNRKQAEFEAKEHILTEFFLLRPATGDPEKAKTIEELLHQR